VVSSLGLDASDIGCSTVGQSSRTLRSMRFHSFGQSASICVLATALAGCMGFPPVEPDPCDALPLSSLFFRYPAIQTRAQFEACTGSENQPAMALFTCPMLPASPFLTAYFMWPMIPVIGLPLDLLTKLAPRSLCKSSAAGEAKLADKPATRKGRLFW
jgi:hypothetical protein